MSRKDCVRYLAFVFAFGVAWRLKRLYLREIDAVPQPTATIRKEMGETTLDPPQKSSMQATLDPPQKSATAS